MRIIIHRYVIAENVVFANHHDQRAISVVHTKAKVTRTPSTLSRKENGKQIRSSSFSQKGNYLITFNVNYVRKVVISPYCSRDVVTKLLFF